LLFSEWALELDGSQQTSWKRSTKPSVSIWPSDPDPVDDGVLGGVVADRKRRAIDVRLAVPTTVRAEAGWDRRASSWAFANRLGITDIDLDTPGANTAASIRNKTGVSMADAHLGAVIQSTLALPTTVVTSDPDDIRLVAGDTAMTIVAI
jgi:hypothetical protein